MKIDIIEQIVFTRKKLGYTQKDIASFLNIGTTTYGDIERKRINLKAEDLIKLTKKLNIDLSEEDTIRLTKQEENIILELAERIKAKRDFKSYIQHNEVHEIKDNHGKIVIGNDSKDD